MNLLDKIALLRLVNTYPGLERERRQILVEFMESLSPRELSDMLECDSMPPEEIAFCRACCGLDPVEARTLHAL
jgi:hypothetical protein